MFFKASLTIIIPENMSSMFKGNTTVGYEILVQNVFERDLSCDSIFEKF